MLELQCNFMTNYYIYVVSQTLVLVNKMSFDRDSLPLPTKTVDQISLQMALPEDVFDDQDVYTVHPVDVTSTSKDIWTWEKVSFACYEN